MHEKPKVGLVLSGGGAKGAYQAGVVKALVELGGQVDVIAGASIGALNGAIISCSDSLEQAAKRLEEVWMMLASRSPISTNNPLGSLAYIALLTAGGLNVRAGVLLAQKVARYANRPLPFVNENSVLSDKPLREIMDEYITTDKLAKGQPLYISVYETNGWLEDITQIIIAEIGLIDTPDSHFYHIQSLPISGQKNALLASAALPFLYPSRRIEGREYTDGGQGGWSRMQGNTPITPLIEAGCNMVIVTHLSDGSLWSRHDYPDTTILEIRPQSSITRDDGVLGGAKDLLGFDAGKIPSWIEQGYRDTLHCLGSVMDAVRSRNELNTSRHALKTSEAKNKAAEDALSAAMSRLRS